MAGIKKLVSHFLMKKKNLGTLDTSGIIGPVTILLKYAQRNISSFLHMTSIT
jgi:hypothetical protein